VISDDKVSLSWRYLLSGIVVIVVGFVNITNTLVVRHRRCFRLALFQTCLALRYFSVASVVKGCLNLGKCVIKVR